MAVSVTQKLRSTHDELLVGWYEQQGHFFILTRLTWMLEQKREGSQEDQVIRTD